MKIRNGFVSNSSSSSFLVICKDVFKQIRPNELTVKEERLLQKYGFEKTNCCLAHTAGNYNNVVSEDNNELESYNYGYSVSCNQDDVIYFLLKHKISFEACCHYGHYTIIYNKKNDYFINVENFGYIAASSNLGDEKRLKNTIKEIESKKPIQKVKVKGWIANYEKWNREFEKKLKEVK